MTTAEIILLASSPLFPIVVGGVGSVIEKAGLYFKLPRVEAFGKMLEAVAADIPKFITNLKQLGTGKAAPK